MKLIEKQAKLERWLASGKPITFMLAVKLWNMTDFRKGITRIRRHVKVDDKWVPSRNGAARYKVYFMRRSK